MSTCSPAPCGLSLHPPGRMHSAQVSTSALVRRLSPSEPCIAFRPQSALARPSFLGRSLATPRSEEHTSELQSLMRISYAVFCLKKKNKNSHNDTYQATTPPRDNSN